MDMNIYEIFACYTNLPIRLDWVVAHIKDLGAADEIQIVPAKIDSQILLGMHRFYKNTDPDGSSKRILQVYYSDELEADQPLKRLVCCKELLHVFDGDPHTAQTEKAVSSLLDQIVVPPSSGMAASTKSDNNGMLFALMVLLPRDALDVIIPAYQANKLNVEDLAQLAGIPENYARLGLSPIWKDIVESI
jgi:hypothetical protein